MRTHELKKDDALRQIAHRFYYVYDDEGVEEPERVERVLREIIKRNPSIIKYFSASSHESSSLKTLLESDSKTLEEFADRPCNADQQLPNSAERPRIVLPKIIGIPFYETDDSNARGQKWWVLLLWVVGLIVGFCLYLVQQYLMQLQLAMASQKQPQINGSQDASQWLWAQLLHFIREPKSLLDASAPGVIIWTLVVVGCWLFTRKAASNPVHRSRLRYLLAWIAGLIVLVPGMYYGLTVLVPGAVPILLPFTELLPLFVIWTVVVFLVYLYQGDGSALYQDYFGEYRGIWAVFALLVMGTVLAGYTGYQQVSRRLQGEMSTLTLADTTIHQLRDTTHALRAEANDLAQKTSTQDPDWNAYAIYHWPSIRRYVDSAADQAQDADYALDAAVDHFRQITQTLALDRKQQQDPQAKADIDSRIDFAREQSNALQQIDIVLTAAMGTTQRLRATADSIQPILLQRAQAGNALTDTVALTITTDLGRQAQDAEMQANVAADSITALAFDGLPIFLWNSILYAAVVLFPWVLLLLFFYRKRKRLAAGIYQDLYRLDSSGRALRNVLSGAGTREEEKLKDRVLKKIPNPFSGPSSRLSNNSTSQSGAATNGKSPASGTTATTASRQQTTDLADMLDEHEVEAVIEALAMRTFNENAYLIGLLLLSLLAAVGWYYVFYPQGSIGLTNLIMSGAGIRQLNTLISTNLTPVTMGFVGGYFFLMQMLVRRYLSNDLYPAAFLQAALRLVIVFTLCLALSVVPFNAPDEIYKNAVGGAVLIAFLVGVFPAAGLQLIISYVNRWQQRTLFPPTIVPEPLTKLTGVTIWVESRLLEENIDTIQGMATAPIEQLVAGTHYPASQIIDWVDQAILYMHSGHDGEWFSSFRAVGVRGATDLLDALGFNLLRPYHSLLQSRDPLDFIPNEGKLKELARAINDANDAGIPRNDLDDPSSTSANIVRRLIDTSVQAAATASQTAALIKQIDPTNAETFKYILQMNQDSKQGYAKLVALKPLFETIASGAQNGDTSDTAKRIGEICKNAANTLKALPSPVEIVEVNPFSALQLQNLQAARNVLDRYTNVARLLTVDGCQLGQLLRGLRSGQPATTALLQIADQLEEKLKDAYTTVERAYNRAVALAPDKPETLDARNDLLARIDQLEKAAPTIRLDVEQLRIEIKGSALVGPPAQGQGALAVLDRVAAAVQPLPSALDDLKRYAKSLYQPNPDMTQKEPAALIEQKFANARDSIKNLNRQLEDLIKVPEMTENILRIICLSIWPDPNMPYILNYNHRSLDCLDTSDAFDRTCRTSEKNGEQLQYASTTTSTLLPVMPAARYIRSARSLACAALSAIVYSMKRRA